MALGRTILSNSAVFPTRVTADGSPKYKAGGVTIDWANTVIASGSVANLTDGSVVGANLKFLRYGQVIAKITLKATDVVTIGGGASGGTFPIIVTTPNGSVTTAQTATLTYTTGLTAAAVQTALVALSNVGTGNATVSGSNGGTATAEVDTFTPTTPTAGDTITITNAAGTELVSIVVGATPSATTVTTQLKQAWATNPQATAIATASGTATFILTGVTAGAALGLTANISGTGTIPVVTTAATVPYTITFADSLGPVTVTTSAASLTGGTPTATVSATAPGGNFGWFGPYDPAATDGRQTLTRGECYVMDQTVLQYSTGTSSFSISNDQIGGVIEGGDIFIDRIIQSGVASHSLSAGPTLAEFRAVFPRFSEVKN